MPLPIVGLSGLLEALLSAKNRTVVPEPDFKPLDLSQLRDLPKETGRPGVTEEHWALEASRPRTVFPPAVPNNQPQI